MSVPPKIAPSLRADRIPLEQVPVVDFEPFRLGGQAERKRAAVPVEKSPCDRGWFDGPN
jgi:hypothetical protein